MSQRKVFPNPSKREDLLWQIHRSKVLSFEVKEIAWSDKSHKMSSAIHLGIKGSSGLNIDMSQEV